MVTTIIILNIMNKYKTFNNTTKYYYGILKYYSNLHTTVSVFLDIS